MEIVHSYISADATPIRALVKDAKVDGIVTAGHGAGGISPRAGQGAGLGGQEGRHLRLDHPHRGRLNLRRVEGRAGQDLTPQKARTLLQLALTFSNKEKQVREWFAEVGSPEFDLS